MVRLGDIIWLAVLAALSLPLLVTEAHEVILMSALEHRYSLGFLTFAFLGACAEALYRRFTCRAYPPFRRLMADFIMWGLYGLAMALVFWLINGGVMLMQSIQILPGGGFNASRNIWKAFFSSVFFTEAFFSALFISLSFGVVFTIILRLGEEILAPSDSGRLLASPGTALAAVDWPLVIRREILYLPFFRIPLLTLVFMLPPALWLYMAAWVEIVMAGLRIAANQK